MKKEVLIIILLSIVALAHGQGIVTGKVTDGTNVPIDAARVMLILPGDSSVVQTVSTDSAGCYTFNGVKRGNYALMAMSLGRKSAKKLVMVWNESTSRVNLTIDDGVQLQEVKITANGITVKGDTTTYVVGRFASGTERNLKDILGRLPNIQVDENTHAVTANGKHVNRILIENQDLFQGNTSVPMENISAEGVKKIDVIDNYSEYNIYEGFRTTNETVINVGVDDKARNKIKGEVEGHYGLTNKYRGRLNSLYLGRKAMFSGVLASNNVGEKQLTFQDIMQFNGGMKNILSGDDPIADITRLMEEYAAFTSNRKDIYRRNSNMASLSCIANPNNKLKVSVVGIYGYEDNHSRMERNYTYQSGLKYSDAVQESANPHNALVNVKLQYLVSKTFNIVYSGKQMLASKEQNHISITNNSPLNDHVTPEHFSTKNNMLFVKRWGKDNLSLMIDGNASLQRGAEHFLSSSTFYSPTVGLQDCYDYRTKVSRQEYVANLFYLHRIGSNNFLRLGTKGRLDKQHVKSRLDQENDYVGMDNHAHLKYLDWSFDAMIAKDRGNFTYSLTLRQLFQHATTDLQREFVTNNNSMFSPNIQLKYSFSPFHNLQLRYQYDSEELPLSSLLDYGLLNSYRQVTDSKVNRFFSRSHKASLVHILMFPYLGVNILNMASLEDTKDGLINEHSLDGIMYKITKCQGARSKMYSWMSSIEYKFIDLPLNARCNYSMNYGDLPVYEFGKRYDAKSNNQMFSLEFVTYYKKGFNGSLKWKMSKNSYCHIPLETSMTTHDLIGATNWHNKFIYIGVNARLSTYQQAEISRKNVYYGFELRYDISKRIMLKASGTDVLHLKERRQMTGSINSFYTIDSMISYMPGHLTAGVVIKY